MRAHGAVASKQLDETLVQAVQRDWRTAPVGDKVRAALGFLEKLTLQPENVTPADADVLRAAGLSDDAIEDAASVAALFATFTRLADTFAFAIPPQASFDAAAGFLYSVGYRFPAPLVPFLGA